MHSNRVDPSCSQLLGSQLNWGLFGVLTVQLCEFAIHQCRFVGSCVSRVDLYHQSGYKDHPFIKSIVYGMYTFEAVQTILLTHDTFHQLAINFGNYEGLVGAYLIGFELVIQSAISASHSSHTILVLAHITAQSLALHSASMRGEYTSLEILEFLPVSLLL